MVAAAGDTEGISTVSAAVCLVLILAGLVVLAVVRGKTSVLQQTPFDKSPAALEQKAQDLLASLGYAETPTDRAYGFVYRNDFRQYAERNESLATYRAQMTHGQPSPISFWYRQSPRHLLAISGVGAVSSSNPPQLVSGMVRVTLDPLGRLVDFDAVPPQVEDGPARPSTALDWAAVLAAAGVDPARFKSAEPQWLPPTAFDARAAWTGSFAHAPEVPMRVEAASWRGKPVYFQVLGPWSRPATMQPDPFTAAQRTAQWVNLALIIAVFGIALLLAWRNLRQNRADLRGASRLGALAFGCVMVVWFCTVNHVPTTAEFTSFTWAISSALFSAATYWILYVALEPHVRRRWPQSMISWSRLLAGGLHHPLVGGHLLIGVAFGVAYPLLFSVPALLGSRDARLVNLTSVLDARRMFGAFAAGLITAIMVSLAVFFLFFLLRVLLRRQWLAGLAFILIVVLMGVVGARGNSWVLASISAVQFGLAIFILIRFGILPMMVGVFVSEALLAVPLIMDVSRWYAGSSLFALAGVLGLTAYAFHTATAGRQLLKESFLDTA
jgi:hypothetical protein